MWRRWALPLALLAAACAAVAEERPRLLELSGAGCENTASGRWYIADDKGYVCPRDTFNYGTGCCSTGALHSCDTCGTDDQCCSQYENCVSCCLKPENEPGKHMHSVYRGRNKPETGHWSTPFQYCQAVCRTTARSTAHENAFILDRKHCFSKLGRPNVPVPPAPPLPTGVSLVTGGPGQSCDAACVGKQMACVASAFASINDCNSLRSKFMCEAGCGLSAPDQTEFPGYVEGSASKNQRPAYCATLKGAAGTAPAFDCARSAGGVRRLCPCQAVPGTRQSGQVDALSNGGGGSSNGDGSGDSGAAQATEGGAALQVGQQGAAGGTQR
jgi:hypothetical protein